MTDSQYAYLNIENQTIKLPIVKSSQGPNALDVTKLYNQTGYFTYDPGFFSTASCKSAITYIDGQNGILKHRGHSIESLCQNYSAIEVMHLILFGSIPNESQLHNLNSQIMSYIANQDDTTLRLMSDFIKKNSANHPMGILMSCVSTFASKKDYIDQNPQKAALQAIADVLQICCLIKAGSLQSDILPNISLIDYLLSMIIDTSKYSENQTDIIRKVLNTLLILHFDHEQNASTATVRNVASTGANLYACIASGVAALWGPAHGGANEAVINMLLKIRSTKNVSKFIEKVKNKEEMLMGFGHRVYKSYDPRSFAIKNICKDLLMSIIKSSNSQEHCEKHEDILKIAFAIEEIALRDEYFIERNLYPNVDFYSGIIYKALGIPTEMFTMMFAMSRTVGWCAQWLEMQSASFKINRPRQVYVG